MLCFFSVWLTRCVNAPEIPSAVSSSVPDCIPVSPLPSWPPPLPLPWFKVCILEDIDIHIVIAQRKRKCSVRHTQTAMYTHHRHNRHVQKCGLKVDDVSYNLCVFLCVVVWETLPTYVCVMSCWLEASMTHLRLSLSHTLPGSLERLSHHSFRCCRLSVGWFLSLFFSLLLLCCCFFSFL